MAQSIAPSTIRKNRSVATAGIEVVPCDATTYLAWVIRWMSEGEVVVKERRDERDVAATALHPPRKRASQKSVQPLLRAKTVEQIH
jgi:hypothetical protein